MQEFNHPNVLKLRGVCLDGGPAPYIIMPFMSNGSLLSHLKQERERLSPEEGSDSLVRIQFEDIIMYTLTIDWITTALFIYSGISEK